MNVGVKIKQLREDANLSLEELAQSSSVAADQIEMIERGDITPSVGILVKLSRSMGTRLGTILDGMESSMPVVSTNNNLKLTVSTSNANVLSRENLSFYTLAGDKVDRNMEPLMVSVKYNTAKNFDASTHEGEEFLYVLEGTMILVYGAESYTVNAGDSIYYDSMIPHYLTTPALDKTARVLAVTYTPY